MEQWKHLRNNIQDVSEGIQKTWWRILKRRATAPNAQTGCESVNSIFMMFDTLLATTKLATFSESPTHTHREVTHSEFCYTLVVCI